MSDLSHLRPLLAWLLLVCATLAGCGTQSQNRVGETSLQSACQAPLEDCKQRCRQNPDGASQNACFTHCLHEHNQCQGAQ